METKAKEKTEIKIKKTEKEKTQKFNSNKRIKNNEVKKKNISKTYLCCKKLVFSWKRPSPV